MLTILLYIVYIPRLSTLLLYYFIVYFISFHLIVYFTVLFIYLSLALVSAHDVVLSYFAQSF